VKLKNFAYLFLLLAVSKNKRISDYVIKKAIIKQNQFTKEAEQWNLKL